MITVTQEIRNKILHEISKTEYLEVTRNDDECILIRNHVHCWRKSFENRIKALLLSNSLDLICVTSSGGYDYRIINKNTNV